MFAYSGMLYKSDNIEHVSAVYKNNKIERASIV